MQPCAVCGGVTINATGHCTQCGTYRGHQAQAAPGSYGSHPPPTGPPGHPQQPGTPGYQQPAGYPQQQVSGSGYPQQPVSGPGYAQPTSGTGGYANPAAGYPMSTPPGYPSSGQPGYPAGAPSAGFPASAPPAGYPSSGAPSYPPTSGGGYPASYPPPPGASPGGRARPFVVPLVALSITLVVLVVAIVVVVIVRGDPGGPGPDPTANANVDPCVVGRWRVSTHREQVPMDGIGQVTFTGGAGAIVEYTADGRGKSTYNRTTYQGLAGGQSIKLEVDGTIEFDFTARDGTLSLKNLHANGTATGFIDGKQVGTPDPLTGSDDPANYTCSGSTLNHETDNYSTTLFKTS